ncbi:SAM-dependent methyltransferase [Bartonella quintana]|nr:SAM-dependent methyltransferase [Bartonella quintana]
MPLIDSANGRKLECYGAYCIIWSERQALWKSALSQKHWANVGAIFTGNRDEEGVCRWYFPKKLPGKPWTFSWNGLSFLSHFTSLHHIGVFPEQDACLCSMEEQIVNATCLLKLLNLLFYTGIAFLIGACAGANVTHVDASKKAIARAKTNPERVGLSDCSICWIYDDAIKFVERELRCQKTYDMIFLGVSAHRRGIHGEIWQLSDYLTTMITKCCRLFSNKLLAIVLIAHSVRASFYTLHALHDEFINLGGRVESGELILCEETTGCTLSTSLFSRWIA